MYMITRLFAIVFVLCASGLSVFANAGNRDEPAPVIGNLVLPPSEFAELKANAFRSLRQAVKQAERIAFVRFDPPCFSCRTLSPNVDDILRTVEPRPLEPARAAAIKALLESELTFNPIKNPPPCVPLYAAAGLVFYLRDVTAILVIYPDCNAARLVQPQASTPYFFDIEPFYKELMMLGTSP